MSLALAIGLLAFVGIASSVLLWEGLAATVGGGRRAPVVGRDHGRDRAKVVVGALGLAIVLWTALGMLTRAR